MTILQIDAGVIGTIVGSAVAVILLLAGLISLASVRYGSQIVRRYSAITHGRAAVLAAAAAPLMVLGFILSDPRRLADPVCRFLFWKNFLRQNWGQCRLR